jgi:tetratricopeptide (TPR) repeat protein
MKPSPIKIACTMIVKDDSEAFEFERCLNSIMPFVNGLYVAVTGVSGQHQKIHDIVKKFNGTSISTTPETHPKIYSQIDGKWIFSNFAEARNVSFGLVPDGYDYLTWIDSDDILNGGEYLVKAATRAKELKLDIVYFTYWYAIRTDKQERITEIIVKQERERLLRPNAFKWVSRLHEVCVPKETGFHPKNARYEYDPSKKQLCVWIHTANYLDGTANAKIAGRNKEILEIQIAEEQYKDPRTLFYLGKTCFDIGTPEMLERAKSLLTRYRAMSGWDAERANSCEYLGLIAAKDNNWRECVRIYWESIQEYPRNRIAYFRLAEAYLNLGLLPFAKHWADVGIKMEMDSEVATVEIPLETKLLASVVEYRIALAENDLERIEKWAKFRHDLIGKDDGLYDEVLRHKSLNEAVKGVFTLSKWLKDNGYVSKVPTILDVLPPEITNQPATSMLYNHLIPPRKWGKKEIAYFARAGIEEWTSENLNKGGLGGSETAVAELSKEWVKDGYKVTVFNDCNTKEGVYDGVKYVPYYKINWNDNFNILILWRDPGLLDKDIKARKLYVDLHDVCSQTDWTKDRMEKVDKVFFKSNWHRKNLPDLPDSKSVVISNGIRL